MRHVLTANAPKTMAVLLWKPSITAAAIALFAIEKMCAQRKSNRSAPSYCWVIKATGVQRSVTLLYFPGVKFFSCECSNGPQNNYIEHLRLFPRYTLTWRRPRPVAKRLTSTSPLTEPQCLFSSPLHFYNTFHKKLDAPWRCSAMGLVIDLPGLGVIPKFGFHQSPHHRNEIYLLPTGLGIGIFLIHAVEPPHVGSKIGSVCDGSQRLSRPWYRYIIPSTQM